MYEYNSNIKEKQILFQEAMHSESEVIEASSVHIATFPLFVLL